MGEMADLAREEYEIEMYGRQYDKNMRQAVARVNPISTEDVLNRTSWVDAQGVTHELKEMEQDYLQNVLYFIYKRRDLYWMKCRDVSIIESFKDGDEFFQVVIRNSTIWKSIIKELQRPSEGFNFEFKVPGESNIG